MSAMHRMRPQLVLLLVLAGVLCATAARPAVPISATVIMYSPYDYTVQGGQSPCIQTVENARKTAGGDRINFIPTLYFGFTGTTHDRYCTDAGDGCSAIDTGRIANFQNGMAACFRRAVDLGFTTLEVSPHLDDASGRQWRNAVPFNPSDKKQGFNYLNIMLQPLAAAFHEVLSPSIKVYFSLTGEMGATLFRQPNAWIPLLPQVKSLVTQADKAALAPNVKVGISTNWNKLCGCYAEPGNKVDPDAYLSNFTALFPVLSKKYAFDFPAIRKLYATVDFIGASYYPYKVDALTPAAFEYTGTLFAKELALYGIDLGALIAQGKSFRLHEFGVGGGKGGNGLVPEFNAAKLLRFTFFGVGGPYRRALDPFFTWEPESKKVPARDILRKFWVRAIRWASKRGGPKYKVDAIYLWSSGSWDITGTAPYSRSSEGVWGDPVSRARIIRYNNRGVVP